MMRSCFGAAPRELVAEIRKEARQLPGKPRIMEVCGTHTVAIFRNGIRDLLSDAVELVSGPGCPVCVTPNSVIDTAVAYARQGCIVTSFGDMMRVPGTGTSLLEERARGADIRVVTSPMAVADIAAANPDRKVIFLAVGFETTAPGTGLLVDDLLSRGLDNVYILVAHKLIPPAMRALLEAGDQRISGFLCPGHVSTIIGLAPYKELSVQFGIPCVIAGFEPPDILLSILRILRQIREGRGEAEIQYSRAVRPEGNPAALRLIFRVFEPVASVWRGLGAIPASGLALRGEFMRFDAERCLERALEGSLKAEVTPSSARERCLCGEVLRGIISPLECPQFALSCTPDSPMGPCMVSSEGACSTYYAFGDRR